MHEMNCKITRNAAKELLKELSKDENKHLKLRLLVTHAHGNHAHYGMDLDTATENDEVVTTDKGIDVILESSEPLLDGVKIDYLYFPEEGYVFSNPSKGNHGDH
jgi:Fe-S cluster assembly iron-binding protein IscA